MEAKKQYFNPLYVVILTVFIDMLGVGIFIPVVPRLLADPRSPDYLLPLSVSVGLGYIILAFLNAIYPLMQFFSAPVLGQLSDRYGRKPVLAISLAGTCISYVLIAIAIPFKNIPLLFFARALDGITGGNLSVAQAAVADSTKPEERAKNFGLIGAAFAIGIVLGPYLGGKISDPDVYHAFNSTTPFWIAALLSLINVVFVVFGFQETRKSLATTLNLDWLQPIKNVWIAFRTKQHRAVFGTQFLYNAGFSFFVTFSGVYLIQRFAFTQGNIGEYFAYIALWTVIALAALTHIISKYITSDDATVLRWSFICTGVFLFLQFVPSNPYLLIILIPPFAIANGLSISNITSLISRNTHEEKQGEILGINSSVTAISQAIPPMLSGFIAAQFSAIAPLGIASGLIIIGGVYFIFAYKSKTS